MKGPFSILPILLIFMLSSCFNRRLEVASTDFYSTELFREVQQTAVFPDSKTFVDCVPKRGIGEILRDYNELKTNKSFDLKKFVFDNFDLPDRPKTNFKSDSLGSMEDHITKLWPVLTRNADVFHANASLIPMPDQYIVPGGRFSEIYYWDSYFTMLGLRAQKRYDLIGDMVGNFAFLIDSLGFIPNGNRNYYLSRSQPPFFSLMVKLLSEDDSTAIERYLPTMRKEYDFWMNGAGNLTKPGNAYNHVVNMPDGTILNRYFDNRPEPRPEAYKEDVHVAKESGRDPIDVYTDIRSAAESGWDFSSRWFANGKDLTTIQTTQLVPVDLNCLMYHMEQMIYQGLMKKGEIQEAEKIRKVADARRRAMLTFFWDPEAGYFFDYNFKTGVRSKIKTLAGAFPLFFNTVSDDIAEQVAKTLEADFLKPGGLVTTANASGQQWDAPNGWAPLQWMAYKGLRNYHLDILAEEIRSRWVKQNRRVFRATGKMMEKYNVLDTTLVAGGGEYPNQDGFGWTNGVALAFIYETKIVKK
jgi:alpha,alpha-trehalase